MCTSARIAHEASFFADLAFVHAANWVGRETKEAGVGPFDYFDRLSINLLRISVDWMGNGGLLIDSAQLPADLRY